MRSPPSRPAAPVLEVFASLQGEGAFVGEPQTFLRLRGCPLRCAWCDTPGSWLLSDADRAHVRAGGAVRHEPAWATPFRALCWVAEVEEATAAGAPRTLSVTGGEPLAWPEFLLGLRSLAGGRRLHLETAGAHPATLARVADAFDHLSLDLKPTADMRAPFELPAALPVDPAAEPAPRTAQEWQRARRGSLAVAAGRDAAAKVVVSGARRADDFRELLDEVESEAPGLPVYLTPATPVGDVPAPSPELLDAVCALARERELAVRVVPQVHRLLRLP